jgi:RNA polymerase sigma-70 factor (ECF subfamily)
VRSRFFRARRQLRRALEQTLDVALQDVFRFDGARCDRIVLAVVQRLTALPAPG